MYNMDAQVSVDLVKDGETKATLKNQSGTVETLLHRLTDLSPSEVKDKLPEFQVMVKQLESAGVESVKVTLVKTFEGSPQDIIRRVTEARSGSKLSAENVQAGLAGVLADI